MITSLKTVTLYVGDQQKALEFYVGKLGFELRRDDDMGPMGRWLEVAPPGADAGLMLADAAGFGKKERIGESADLVFRSDDVVGLRERLTALGVSVTEPEGKQWGTFVKVTDPDGHTFVVTQAS